MAYDIEKFLDHAVRDYLIGDLTRLRLDRIGYPLVMSAFSGVELLGALLSTKLFNKNSGAEYFRDYWSQLLYPSVHKTEDAANALYSLARHGLAHGFVLKGPVVVDFDKPGLHLKRDEEGLIYLNANKLADDFISTYEKKLVPLLKEKLVLDRMQSRLDEMDAAYKQQSDRIDSDMVFELASAKDAYSDSAAPAGPSGPCGQLFGSKLRIDRLMGK